MKKILGLILVTLLTISCLFGCGKKEEVTTTTKEETTTVKCEHEWAEATCTESKYCIKCGKTEGHELGHNYSSYEVISEPTCLTDGEKVATCDRCGKEVSQKIDKLSHTWDEGVDDLRGNVVCTCVNCGEVKSFGYDLPTVVYNNIEITFYPHAYTFEAVDNMFSEWDGHYCVCMPCHIKNKGSDNSGISFLDYDVFGSKGTELDLIQPYFDYDITNLGQLRPEAECDTYFYFLYDGDGKYYIDFGVFSTKA